jgi:hypothetical protein
MALSRRQLVEASEVQVSNGVAADYFRLILLHGIGPARYAELSQIHGYILRVSGVYP